MHYICPSCNTENKSELTFNITEYICKSCSKLIDVNRNSSQKVVKKPTENVVLEVGQKGVIEHVEYTVIAIIVRKYGSDIFWREYFLKDYKNNDAFLSESDGHWIFLKSVHSEDVKKEQNDRIAVLNTKNYRWYETTPCSIDSATGFFEDKLSFKLAKYKEYVNGTEIISQEQSGNTNHYFFGKHISKFTVKKSFGISQMPNYSGIGIVQPYYFDIKQMINIFGIAAILICLLQFYVYTSRTNNTVFQEAIKFEEVKNKEMISKSFTLSGGAAPLRIESHSDVDNSWANFQLSLVNEQTNEITYASKDIEEYHGYEDGESWSEGKKSADFNICGVTSGKYHFAVSAEKDGSVITPLDHLRSPDSRVEISRDKTGLVTVTETALGNITTFSDGKALEKDTSAVSKLARESFGHQKLDSLINAEAVNLSTTPINNSVTVKAIWLPVSFWNFIIIIITMIIIFSIIYWGRYLFNVSKWKNSSNSPYPQSS
ncbi:DUF4178 domain-containing protein [Chryseobacterium sp. Leaf394]|uniref:DUF4178 domain-containing protein n=1 Tax=Chryseobacterium sp. Leaf394 TaxID=1736361 RepID=UPI0006F988A3|nr:DUF4178 domain-containing protein [Chryseobacterium sp. Leaf394]KQS93570.1 hypothetical protein ASG21_00940 [Chryseobacterium sp. Leaf394]